MQRGSNIQRRAGFTLVEVVITMLIIGILAAVAGPKFAKTLHRMRAESAAKRIKSDLNYVRQMAISRSGPLTVTFMPASNDYSIPGLSSLSRNGAPYAVSLSVPPYNALLVSATLGTDSVIQFDHYGHPDSGGTITVKSGGYLKTVSIDPETGKASIP